MKSLLAAFAAAVLLTAGMASAQLLPGGTDADPDKLRATEALGVRIYRHDRAAALATDALLAKRKYRNDKRVAGWLTEAREDAVLVSFVSGRNDEAPAILYQITVPDADASRLKPEAFDPPKALSPSQHSALLARKTVLASQFEACTPSYNTVVLPSSSGEPGWSVFLLPSSADAKRIPFGGAHRMEVSGDGTSITQSRKYTNSCIAFERSSKPRNADEALLFVSHLLDPAPTELHIWLNLMIGKPVMVMTTPNRSAWVVEKARISFVRKYDDEDAAPRAAEDAATPAPDKPAEAKTTDDAGG